LEKIRDRVQNVEGSGEDGKRFLNNIKAYISDSEYFLKKHDLVRASECVVWAWAWLEIGLDLHVLTEK